MAVKAVSLTGTVEAGSEQAFLSPPIRQRHRPVSVLLWTSVSETGSKFSVFLTRSPTPVAKPEPGDPTEVQLFDIQTYGTNVFMTPLAARTFVDPPASVAVYFYNAAASGATIVATYVYETEE